MVALDNFSKGYHQPLELLQSQFGKEKLRIYEHNINDPLDDVFAQEERIDALLHYAALCSVNESMQQPDLYFANNTCGANNVITRAMHHGVKHFVFSSTSEVYGNSQYMPVDEAHPTIPTNPYGESKRMVEIMLDWYAKQQGISYVSLRYFNVTGASDDGLIGDSKNPSVHLVQNAVRGALNIEPFKLTCQKVDTPDGSPIRDYVNVVDLNEAHIKALEYLFAGKTSACINIGTGTGNSVLEMVHNVQDITGISFDIGEAPSRQGEPTKKIASITKAKELLGWEPQRSIGDSVQSLVTWYKKHPHGWER